MPYHPTLRALLLGSALCLALPAAHAADKPNKAPPAEKTETPHDGPFKPEAKITDGTGNVGGRPIAYSAVAGTLVVHAKGWDDVPKAEHEDGKGDEAKEDDDRGPSAVASMFYVAYLAKGAAPEGRPVTFLFNGGPGSASTLRRNGGWARSILIAAESPSMPWVGKPMSKACSASLVVLLSASLQATTPQPAASAGAGQIPVYPVDANCHEALDLWRGSELSPARKRAFEQDCVRRQQEAYDAVKDVWPLLRDKDRQACVRIVQTQNYLQLRNCVADQYAQGQGAARSGTAHFQP